MSLSGKKGSSSGSRGSTSNGRKRKLSSRSHNSNTLFNSSTSNKKTTQSLHRNSTPETKRRRSSALEGPSSAFEGSSSLCFDLSSTSASPEDSRTHSPTTHARGLDSDMAHMPVQGQSPFGNNFKGMVKGAGVNNHKRPGQGKKLVIKNRKGRFMAGMLWLKFPVKMCGLVNTSEEK